MAFFNLTVEDCSPLVSYYPPQAWVDSSSNDSLASQYSGSSLHTTNTQGASATIEFQGTGISIFGGHRPTYGSFNFTVDDNFIGTGDANSDIPIFNQLLGELTGLTNGQHTAVITNDGASIDIDSVKLHLQLSGDDLNVTSIDDNNSGVDYLPQPSDWQQNFGDDFAGGSLHYTGVQNAQASMIFSGNAIALFGTVSPDHANIQVSIDGGSSTISTGGSGGFVSSLHTQTLLFYSNDIENGNHTITVTCDQEENTGPFLDVDSFIVFSTTSGAASTTDSVPSTSSTNISGPEISVPSKLPVEAIVGIAVGGSIGILMILGLLIWYQLLRTRRKSDVCVEKARSFTPELPLQDAEFSPIAPPTTAATKSFPLPKQRSVHSIASYYTQEPTNWESAHRRYKSDISSSLNSMAPLRQSMALLTYPNSSNGLVPVRPATRPPTVDFSSG